MRRADGRPRVREQRRVRSARPCTRRNSARLLDRDGHPAVGRGRMKRTFDAWHLPGLDAAGLELVTYEIGELHVRAPRLKPEQLSLVMQQLGAARTRVLRNMTDENLIGAIARAAAHVIGDPETRTLIAAATGYSVET